MANLFEREKKVELKKREAAKRGVHMTTQIRRANSFAKRDKTLRRLAAMAYKESRNFEKAKDPKMALQWMKVCAKFLKLSIEPARLSKIEAKIEELEKLVEEQTKPKIP